MRRRSPLSAALVTLRPPRLPAFARVLAAPAAVLAAAAVQHQLVPRPSTAPFVLFFLAVAIASWLGGRLPGVAATFFGAALANYHFVGPADGWQLDGPALVATALFLASSLAVALLCGSLRVALEESDERAKCAREREERLAIAASAAELGIVTWEVRADRAAWENRRVFEIFGRPEAEGALSMADLLRTALHPEDRDGFERALGEGMRPGGRFAATCRIRRQSDGATRWLEIAGRFERDAGGDPERLLAVVADVTERTRLEAERERTRRDLGLLFETSVSVMRQSSLEGLLEATAEAARRLTGARVATCGHGFRDGQFYGGASSRAPGASACLPSGIFRLERGGVILDLVEGRKSLRLADAELRAHPRWWGLPEGHAPLRGLLGVRLEDREGRISGMILATDKEEGGEFTAVDESLLLQLGAVASLAMQHIEARVRVEESDRRKDDFLAMLSHELRNPLAPITTCVHLLGRGAPLDERARGAVATIGRQAAHLGRLVDDLLDVTRIAKNKLHLQRAPLDLGELLRAVRADNAPLFADRALEASLPEGPVRVDGDRARLVQAVGNLLANAAKFTSPGDRVELRLRAEAGEAVIEVADTGIGIDAPTLARLFTPFVQADRSLDRTRGGLGVGLALVRSIVELHGGRVEAHSDGVGQGARLVLRLPRLPDEPAAPAPAPTACAPRPSGGALRILVIEDNADAAQSLADVLALDGHEVEIAATGPDGIAKARASAPDVVFCDIGLPGLDGYAVARALKGPPSPSSALIVALSGYAQAEDAQRAAEAGFDAHLSKPPDLEAIDRLLARALGVAA